MTAILTTDHTHTTQDATHLKQIDDACIDLVVTSPPYPMIEMWDTIFSIQDASITTLLKSKPSQAFEQMHQLLDKVWAEAFRVLKPGGFICINIGDATRTIGDQFQLFPNHSRILTSLCQIGFTILPEIIWRKQTNAPNKFMGSGMLPAGAYVTLEHEYILIARKGGKRIFTTAPDKLNRRQSALFWEERNLFFSDIWFDIKGTRQTLPPFTADQQTKTQQIQSRGRSAAFPFELVYRLINMYSVKNDTVLDPFMGTGTTRFAGMVAARNTIGIEIDPKLSNMLPMPVDSITEAGNQIISNRLQTHNEFVKKRKESGKDLKHVNTPYGFEVVTNQETDLFINPLDSVRSDTGNQVNVQYSG